MSIKGPQDLYPDFSLAHAFTSSIASTSVSQSTSQSTNHPQGKVDESSPGEAVAISDKAALVLHLEEDYDLDLSGLSLSEDVLTEIDSLFQRLGEIEDSIAYPPLTAARQKELQAIQQQVAEIYSASADQPMSATDNRRLDELQQQMDDILGPPSLTADQEEKLDAIYQQIDDIFNRHFDPEVLDDEIVELESLFQARDGLLLGQELTEEQEAEMVKIEQQIDMLLDQQHDQLSEEADELLDRLFEELETILGNTPLTEEQQKGLRSLDEQLFSILQSAEQGGLSRGEKQQLDDLFYRADKLLGHSSIVQEQSQRIQEIKQEINQLILSGRPDQQGKGRLTGYEV